MIRKLATVSVLAVGTLLVALAGAPAAVPDERHDSTPAHYTNPVSASFADTFADPSVVRAADGWYYAYATSDPLRSGEGTRHYLPAARSRDLAHWTYVGDAFTAATLPAWADRSRDASLWAPDIRYVDGQYRLYYVVTETTVTDEPNDNAIGVATAPTPAGPWTDSGAPVVGPRRGGSGGPGDFRWTFDPAAVTGDDGRQYLFYGSYYGGIWAVRLDATGTRTDGEPVQVAIDNKFEGAYVVKRGGWWYLFASTANCCAGPTTGYSVQVGRSRSLTGSYLDAEGSSLLISRAGGTPVLVQNGNRWVGAGHNAIATDAGGRDWIVYHAVDRNQPYLDGTGGIMRRPMLIDPLNWVDGWPTVRHGLGPSDGWKKPASGDRTLRPRTGAIVPGAGDEFDGPGLAPGWTTVRSPQAQVASGALVWPTEDADLVGSANQASVLLRTPSRGDWTAETKVSIDLGTDTVRNYQQAGLIAYVDDDLFARLDHVAIWNTRQTEFGKEMAGEVTGGRLSYGGTIVGPPAETTWLRLSHRTDRVTGEHLLRAWTSRDGRTWVRGGVWTLPAGTDLKVGLVSHGGAGATARFDYLRFYRHSSHEGAQP